VRTPQPPLLLVPEFFPAGRRSVIICEIIVNLLVMVQNKKNKTKKQDKKVNTDVSEEPNVYIIRVKKSRKSRLFTGMNPVA
jgi:hypothetical protein